MNIYVNDVFMQVEENLTLFQLKKTIKSHADIVIYNSFPVHEDRVLNENDRVVFIKKGEALNKEEFQAQLMARHTPNVYEKLKKATVAVAGLGGLGSNVSMSLARVGIGKLILVDYDVVEPSNLNRQQYFIKHIGMKKTEAIKDLINNCNPFIKVQAVDTYVNEKNIKSIFKDADIIVEAFDNAKDKAMLTNEVLCNMKDKIIITASGLAGYDDCNLIKTKKINSRFYIVGDKKTEAMIARGLMAPRTCVAANHEANLVIELIMKNREE